MQLVDTLRRLRERPRLWRALVVSAFLIPVLLVLPNARSLVVRNAVVTAYLSDFRAPIDGQVKAIYVPPGGTPEPGQAVVELENSRVDQSRVARLRVESESTVAEVEQAQRALVQLRELAELRASQVAEYDRAIERDLKALEDQLHKQQTALDASLAEAESTLARVRRLLESGLSSAADLEIAVANFENARTQQLNNREAIRRLELQWDELQQGVYQIDFPDGALFTRQMQQNLRLQLLQAEQALHSAQAERKAKAAELEHAQLALEQQRSAVITLPQPKSVFDIYTSQGAWVEKGSRLLSAVDCSRLLVDVELDDALLQLVEPGQQLEVRVFGSLKRRSATVILVRGSAALSDTPVLAADVDERGAYAEFEDIGLFTLMFYPLVR